MSLLSELRRRNVLQMAALYFVGVWVVIQVAESVFPGWGVPDSSIRYVWIAAILGLPIALIFSWRFDVTTKGIKRLAIQVEDHPLDYANFEGTIPEGNYGAGKVKIWDKGSFELIKKNPKEIEFKLQGKKMKGTFVLIKTHYGSKPEKSWLFFKVG